MTVCRSISRFWIPGIFLFVLSAFSRADDELILALGDHDYHKREKAMVTIVRAAASDQDRILKLLMEAERHRDPEISRRASASLEKVFLRYEKGYGAPECGLVVKSKLVSIKMKLGTRPLVDKVEEGSASESSGIKKGDLILSVNGVTFDGEDGVEQLSSLLKSQTGGAKLVIRYSRKGEKGREEFETTLKLAEGKPMPEKLDEDRPEFEIWKRAQIERLENKQSGEITPE